LSPAIDTLRAQVELQTRQQQLIAASNDFAKQKLTSGSVIGLPPGQEFVLTEKAPYQALTPCRSRPTCNAPTLAPDYQAAQAQVRAAELSRRAATAGSLSLPGLECELRRHRRDPGHSNGTWQVNGGINIPIFAGGKTHSDVLEAEAQLKQARSQLGDLRGRIDYEVRSALLDLNSAADQVEVARSSVNWPRDAGPIPGSFHRRRGRQSGSSAGAGIRCQRA
jgi:outer membrane protein TolC